MAGSSNNRFSLKASIIIWAGLSAGIGGVLDVSSFGGTGVLGVLAGLTAGALVGVLQKAVLK